MYASDYGFVADPEALTTTLYNYNGSVNNATIGPQNWIHMGYTDWTISRDSDYLYNAFYVDFDGPVRDNIVHNNHRYGFCGVRVTFNLDQSVPYVSGTGTQSDPIIIN